MTVETFELRDYQRETVDALYGSYGAGNRRVVTVVPTGGGKTVIGTRVVADCIASGRRVLWLAHRTELIEQAAESLRADTSGMSVGILQSRRREVDRHVIVASMLTAVQPGALSLLKRARIGLIVVDECHHAVAASYMTIMRELGALEPGGPLVYGITATLDRSDGLALGDLWEDVAHAIPIQDLIARGFLLPPRGIRVKLDELQVGKLRENATQTQVDKAYGRAMSDSLAPAAIARAVLKHCPGRKGVAFLPTVELSREQARVFVEHGLNAIHVDADTPSAVRREIMKRARAGRYDVVCNVGICTEGTDVPVWSYVVLGRMTSSTTLYTQMLGRGLRPYPGQTDCLVLDPVGVTARHRLRVLATLDGAPQPEDIPPELLEYEIDETEPNEPETDSKSPKADAEPGPEGADGPLTAELVDLFSASHTAWLQTPRGVWFLPTGDSRALFLAPGAEVGTYDVQWTDGEVVHEAAPLDTAMSWGEKAARAAAKRDLDRAAGWRQRKLTRAERLAAVYRGFTPDDVGRDAGTLSASRDRLWAARVIDVLPCVEKVTPESYWTTY